MVMCLCLNDMGRCEMFFCRWCVNCSVVVVLGISMIVIVVVLLILIRGMFLFVRVFCMWYLLWVFVILMFFIYVGWGEVVLLSSIGCRWVNSFWVVFCGVLVVCVSILNELWWKLECSWLSSSFI